MPCAAVVAVADCIARTACAMCAAHLLPRDRCAARLNSRRRYAPMLPRLAVARVACCRMAPVLLLRRGSDCRPSRLTPPAPPRAHRPPGSCPLLGVLPPPLFGAARCRAMLAMIAIIILIYTISYTYNIVQSGMLINHLCTVSNGQYRTFSGNF